MEKVILEKLSEIESKRNVRILYACESGSRAWGFPSPDSDYDVRFIYAHPLDWYLSIGERKDIIELPMNEVLDVNGWDIRKALRLLAKGNAVLGEWIQSPVVYLQDNEFAEGFRKLAADCFNPIAVMHHYLSMCKKHYEEATAADHAKLKKYLYCLRAALSCEWIRRNKTLPPMELEKLMVLVVDASLAELTRSLVTLKATKEESYLHPREQALDEFLKTTIEECAAAASTLPGAKYEAERLDVFFRKTLRS